MYDYTSINNMIRNQLINVHTAFIGKVLSINDNSARIQPLTMYKATGGEYKRQSPVSAVIPQNIKHTTQTITYMTSLDNSKTVTVLVPAELRPGDIVYCGVCDRDITDAKKGNISRPSIRHHDMNDGVILAVL